MTGYLCVPAPGRWPRWDIGAPLRHMVTSWASCYGTGGCAPSLRVAKRAICKFPKARAPGINRRGYEAALRIDVFIASGP